MNYYWQTQSDGHDRFRLEPWPNDFRSRVGRDLQHRRFHGLGVQLHRGHYSEGCINVLQDDPAAMQQYDMMMNLLMSEDGNNFLTVIE
jgi:hypothetical protein